jgi:hypothetical protein
MKTVSKLVGIIAFIAIIGLGFIGCPPEDDNDGNGNGGNGSTTVPETDVQVYNKDGTPYTGSGTIKYQMASGGTTIDAGMVTDGKLTLSLPSSSAMISFYGSKDSELLMDGLCLYPGNIRLGYIGQTGNKSYSLRYIYSKTDVKLNRTNPSLVQNYDFKAGWVKLLWIDESGKASTDTSTLSGMPSNMKWTLTGAF